MEQNALLKQERVEEGCAEADCLTCCDCKVINMGEKRHEVKSSLQLYAKEAEHYFFYYDLNLQQV